jgi:hypothetical protein
MTCIRRPSVVKSFPANGVAFIGTDAKKYPGDLGFCRRFRHLEDFG